MENERMYQALLKLKDDLFACETEEARKEVWVQACRKYAPTLSLDHLMNYVKKELLSCGENYIQGYVFGYVYCLEQQGYCDVGRFIELVLVVFSPDMFGFMCRM